MTEESRREYVEFVRRTLGIEPTEQALFDRLRRQLPAEDVERLRVLAGRRPSGIATLAAVSLAIERLGLDWWRRPRTGSEVTRTKEDGVSPVELIRGEEPLSTLRTWAVEDVADDEWPPAAGFVDINTQRAVNATPAPSGSTPGDHVTFSWDAGCRVLAVVEERDGFLGITIPGQLLYSVAEEVWDSWYRVTESGIATS